MLRIFAIAAAVYVLVRVLFVAALGDVFLYGEELEKGTVAKALLEGIDVPYWRLPFHPYEGGGFVASHLKALGFLAFGENVLAHKAVAILWGLLVLLGAVGLAYRFGGAPGTKLSRGGGAAMIAGLLVALGPAHFQKQSMLHLGIHFEALFFIGFVFWLGLAVARTPRGERVPPLTLFGLGLASGFGTYFSFQVPIAVLSVIGLLAWTGWRRIFHPALVGGTLLGLVPLALMFAAVGPEILDIHGSNVGDQGGFSRMADALRRGLFTGDGLPIFAVLSGGLAVVAGCIHARPVGDRRLALGLFWVFCLLWVLVAGASGMVQAVGESPHWVRFIRFAPLVFGLLLTVALAAGPAISAQGDERRTPSAKMARIGVTLLISIGAVHATRTIDSGRLTEASANLATLRSVHGYELRGAFAKIFPRLVADGNGAAAAEFGNLQGVERQFLLAEMASAMALAGRSIQPEAVPGPGRTMFDGESLVLGMGGQVFQRIREDVAGALGGGAIGAAEAEALGRFGTGFLSFESYVPKELSAARGSTQAQPFIRGLGRRIFRSGVMQPYWGNELVLRPAAMAAYLTTRQEAIGASPEELGWLLEGLHGAARDYGFELAGLAH